MGFVLQDASLLSLRRHVRIPHVESNAFMGLSFVVASVAVVPSALGWALQPYLPSPATFVLFHVAASGFAVALAAVEPWAHQTTRLLGKVSILPAPYLSSNAYEMKGRRW